jgi:Fur family zinc uptake transcriptional regulator
MVSQTRINKVLSKAEKRCVSSGTRLTEKRKKVLEIMVNSKIPLSPYEVVDQYNEVADSKMPANSAYRILDFLVSENLAHKLASAQKYIACSHITCNHTHEVPQFLICGKCQKVQEVGIKTKLMQQLKDNVESTGYSMTSQQLEIQCLCPECQ